MVGIDLEVFAHDDGIFEPAWKAVYKSIPIPSRWVVRQKRVCTALGPPRRGCWNPRSPIGRAPTPREAHRTSGHIAESLKHSLVVLDDLPHQGNTIVVLVKPKP